MNNLVYLAGPFFSDRQKSIIDNIETIIRETGFNVYSPMKECLFEKGKTDPNKIFVDNIEQICKSCMIVAITDGKDVGTIFEAGYAYGLGVPVVYVWLDSKGMKFNIMLKESSIAVCLSYEHLRYTLKRYMEDRFFATHPDIIDMELE